MSRTVTNPKIATIAERWRAGNEHYQAAFAPTGKKISERAQKMHDEGRSPEEIVEMAAEESSKFAREYHNHEE